MDGWPNDPSEEDYNVVSSIMDRVGTNVLWCLMGDPVFTRTVRLSSGALL